MSVSVKDQIRPDLIADHFDIIFFKDLKSAFQLLSLPDPPAGIVGRAENGGMNVIVADPALHVVKVHAPAARSGSRLAVDQRAVHDPVAIVAQGIGKTDIGRRVDKDIVSPGTEHIQGTDKAAEHAVLVSDTVGHKFLYGLFPVAPLMPAYDRVKIFLPRRKISESRMLQPLRDRLDNGGRRGKIHIRDPHGNYIKSFRGSPGRKSSRISNRINRQRVVAAPVHNGTKIVFHIYLSCRSVSFHDSSLKHFRESENDQGLYNYGRSVGKHICIKNIPTEKESQSAFHDSYLEPGTAARNCK